MLLGEHERPTERPGDVDDIPSSTLAQPFSSQSADADDQINRSAVHAAFRDCLAQPIDAASLHSWRDLSRLIEQRMLRVYEQDPAARQLILASHGLAEVTQADRQHDDQLGQQMQALFAHYFQLPPLPEDIDVFALALELGDRVYARSVQQFGLITPRLAEEGLRVFDAYLSLYLPPHLPRQSR